MTTYRVHFRDGTSTDIDADWTEEHNGMKHFVQQREVSSTAPWPEGDAAGGVLMAFLPIDSIASIERIEDRGADVSEGILQAGL